MYNSYPSLRPSSEGLIAIAIAIAIAITDTDKTLSIFLVIVVAAAVAVAVFQRASVKSPLFYSTLPLHPLFLYSHSSRQLSPFHYSTPTPTPE